MKNPLYYKCSQVFDLVEESNYLKSLKTALYEITYPEDKDFKRIYCICVETDKNKTKINQIIKEIFDCDKITYESLGLTNGLLKVLLYELYFSGRRLKMGGKEIKYIKSKRKKLIQY